MEFPEQVNTALRRLREAGYTACAVGGCVRDRLMSAEPKDYDVTTAALPEQTEAVFAGERIIETGLKHGTVTVLLGGLPIEITTFRVDGGYSDARHPDAVRFTPSLTEDLAHRDFTVNAMAWSPEDGLADPFGGADDLRNRLIRCVGDPDTRFREDALRILRALRFAAVLGFRIEERTADALHRNRALLDKVSAERIAVELCKLLFPDSDGHTFPPHTLYVRRERYPAGIRKFIDSSITPSERALNSERESINSVKSCLHSETGGRYGDQFK